MIRPGSQNDRVLAVLADGLPHSASEIHRRAGFMRLNSRVAELRSKEGLEITCEHIGGTGPDAFVYTLTFGEADPRSARPDGGLRAPVSPIHSPAADSSPLAAPVVGVQLSLEVAA